MLLLWKQPGRVGAHQQPGCFCFVYILHISTIGICVKVKVCLLCSYMDESLVAHRFGATIKNARERKNMTQTELGMLVGIDATRVSRYESGAVPRPLLFVALCEAVGLKPEKVLRQIVTPPSTK